MRGDGREGASQFGNDRPLSLLAICLAGEMLRLDADITVLGNECRCAFRGVISDIGRCRQGDGCRSITLDPFHLGHDFLLGRLP